MNLVHAFPLEWPDGVARTEHPAVSRFVTAGVARPLRQIDTELRRFGAEAARITANVPVSKRGEFLALKSNAIPDPGVALYFALAGAERVLACDRWDEVDSNLRAIGNTLAALRGMERWGCADVLARSLEGFKALPAPEPVAPARPWWEVLHVAPDADAAVVEAAYRALAKRAHPDVGGDPVRFRAIAAAYERARTVAR